jgi:hypothetical protein
MGLGKQGAGGAAECRPEAVTVLWAVQWLEEGSPTGRSGPPRRWPSDRADVGRLETLLALLNLEFDLLAFFERAIAIHLNSGVMDEHVRSALL